MQFDNRMNDEEGLEARIQGEPSSMPMNKPNSTARQMPFTKRAIGGKKKMKKMKMRHPPTMNQRMRSFGGV